MVIIIIIIINYTYILVSFLDLLLIAATVILDYGRKSDAGFLFFQDSFWLLCFSLVRPVIKLLY